MNRSHQVLKVLLFVAFCGFIAGTTMTACSEESSKEEEASKEMIQLEQAREQGAININGVERTELALLMRKMHDDLESMKVDIQNGKDVDASMYELYQRIKDAHPTEPQKIDAVYQSMADAFLANYERFEQAEGNQVEAYNIMLDNCLACHQQKCPGPVKAINKLKIKP